VNLQQQSDRRFAARKGGQGRLENRNMTPIANLLKQKSALCLHALEQTQDLNEAHLLVHGVMTRALARVDGAIPDLGSAMTLALDARAQRLTRLAALT